MNATAPAAAATAPETLKGKPGTHQCPQCTYSAMTAGSLQGHVAMAHEAGVPVQVEITPRGRRMIERQAEAIADGVDRGPFLVEVPLELVDIGENVRVDPGELAELAASITELGVLQPIRVIGPSHDGRYRAVWGQRRVMASIIAKKATIPALVELEAEANVPGARRSIEQLAENLQRKDLNPIEEAVALRAVLEATKGLTQEQLATKLGRSGAWVSNTLRLLETAPEVQELVRTEKLTTAHAKAIAGLDVDLQAEFAATAVRSKWTSADTERQAKWAKDNAARTREQRAAGEKHAATAIAALEKVANRTTATIYVETYGAGETVKRLLAKDGWKTAPSTYSIDTVAKAGSCGCKGIWKVNVPYGAGSATVSPACDDAAHKKVREADREAGWKRDREKQAAERKAQAELERGQTLRLGEILGVEPLAPLTLRLAVYAMAAGESDEVIGELLGIDDDDEVLDNVASEVDVIWAALEALPDAQLATTFAKAIAVALDDQWRVGQPVKDAIAALLAAHSDPDVPAAKPARGKKAAAT